MLLQFEKQNMHLPVTLNSNKIKLCLLGFRCVDKRSRPLWNRSREQTAKRDKTVNSVRSPVSACLLRVDCECAVASLAFVFCYVSVTTKQTIINTLCYILFMRSERVRKSRWRGNTVRRTQAALDSKCYGSRGRNTTNTRTTDMVNITVDRTIAALAVNVVQWPRRLVQQHCTGQ